MKVLTLKHGILGHLDDTKGVSLAAPTQIKCSAVQTVKCWSAEHEQYMLYEQLHSLRSWPSPLYCKFTASAEAESHAIKIDEEDFEFGKKVVEILRKQFAKMALARHQHTDIWDICKRSQLTIARVSSMMYNWDHSLRTWQVWWEPSSFAERSLCWWAAVQQDQGRRGDLHRFASSPGASQVQRGGWGFAGADWSSWLLRCPVLTVAAAVSTWVTCGPSCKVVGLPKLSTKLVQAGPILEKPLPMHWLHQEEDTGEDRWGPMDCGVRIWGKDASSGHYYATAATGKRSEPMPSGDCGWCTMDDSKIQKPDVSKIQGSLGVKPWTKQ